MKNLITNPLPKSDITYSLKSSLIDDQINNDQSAFLERQRELFFRDLQSYPEKTIFLGFDQDIIPVLLDLTKPASGSILFLEGIDSLFERFIKNLSISCSWKNNRNDVVFGIISPEADNYIDLLGLPGCQFLLNPYERAAAEVIFELAGIAEQRKYGRERGPAMLLIIDDLWSYLCHNSDYGTFVNLKWLINYGPSSEIWPISSIQVKDRQKFKQPFLSLFRTIISEMKNQPEKLLPAWQSQNLEALNGVARGTSDCLLKVGDSIVPLTIP